MGFIQIRTLQLDFGITTMGAYQSIGVVTDLMMFSPCIPFRSGWTFSVMGRGGRAGCSNGEGLTRSWSWISYTFAISPSPLITCGHSSLMPAVRVRSMIPKSWRALIAGLPSSGSIRLETKNNSWAEVVFFIRQFGLKPTSNLYFALSRLKMLLACLIDERKTVLEEQIWDDTLLRPHLCPCGRWWSFHWPTFLHDGVDRAGRQVSHIFVVRWNVIMYTINSAHLVL